MHAAQRRSLEAATEKIAADVRNRLSRAGLATSEDEPWPALAAAARMIADLPANLAKQVLERLPEQIREEVVERLYSFASLREQSDRNIQKLIATIARRTLATSLIGADSVVHEVIVRNMSRRAATMLDEDVESLIQAGELSTRDVREARAAVSRTLFGLHESGEVGR